jgi:CheY-like chemotaxis protein
VSAPLVLIADNDRAVSSLLGEVLARAGLAVQCVFDGETAREKAREHGVAVLVCDLDMPRRSGVEVIESLADLSQPPLVVVVSGYLDGGIQRRLGAMPYVRGVLPKPFDLLAFAEKVRVLAHAHRAAVEASPPLARGTEL